MAVNGVNRYIQIATKAQFPQSAKVDPVNNNLPNSSKDGNYPYNPSAQRAQEPVVTNSSGGTSSKLANPMEIGGVMGGGVLRLQAVLANRKYAREGNNPPQESGQVTTANFNSSTPQTTNQVNSATYNNRGVTIDNSGNMFIPQDLLGYTTPMDAEKQIQLVDKYEKKKFNRDALFAGVSQLGAALGGRAGKYSTVFGSFQGVD